MILTRFFLLLMKLVKYFFLSFKATGTCTGNGLKMMSDMNFVKYLESDWYRYRYLVFRIREMLYTYRYRYGSSNEQFKKI
jgi:hypothetical protein